MPSAADIMMVSGSWGRVACAARANGSVPAKEFFDGLVREEQAKVLSLFHRMAEIGRITNTEQFRKVQGDVWEFKKFQIRFSCYQVERTWFLLHGFRKKQDRWPRREIDTALAILNEHRNM
jgi:phage-related protein